MNKLELLVGLTLSNERTEIHRDAVRRFGKKYHEKDEWFKINQWYHEQADKDIKDRAKKYSSYLSVFSTVATIIFFLVGIGIGGVLFKYDGTNPINVLPILLFFVCIPFILLVISITVVNWNRLINLLKLRLNITSIAEEGWRGILRISSYFKKGEYPYHINNIYEQNKRIVNNYFKILIQKSSLAYIMGACIVIFIKIITTDLAFSWSSTLNMSSNHMYHMTEIISTPWQDIMPTAVIEYEMIEKTRHYRATGETIPEGATAQDMGVWWSFLMMSILLYNLLPRLLAYYYYRIRLPRIMKRDLLRYPYTQRLLEIMEKPNVQEGPQTHPINSKDWNNNEVGGEHSHDIQHTSDVSAALLWRFDKDGIDIESIKKQLNVSAFKVFQVGGSNTIKQDDEIIDKVSDIIDGNNTRQEIVVLVRYWESPDVDLIFFLRKLRGRIGKKLIKIIPILRSDNDANKKNEKSWHARINEIGDPWLIIDNSQKVLVHYMRV